MCADNTADLMSTSGHRNNEKSLPDVEFLARPVDMHTLSGKANVVCAMFEMTEF